jgi:hypothetical protein
LVQLIFGRDVLHLVKRDLAEQAVSASILAVLLKHGFSLLAGFGILRRRDEQIPEMQTSVQILGDEIYRAGEGLACGSRILLLDLQDSQAVIGIAEVRIDLDSLAVFVLCRGELFLREVLVPFFDVLSGASAAAASRKKPESRGKQQNNYAFEKEIKSVA